VGGDQEAEALTAVTINVVKKSGRKPSGAFVSTQDTLGKALANIKEQQRKRQEASMAKKRAEDEAKVKEHQHKLRIC
jgi:hypothetical protein